jgi:hypothetical protein
MKTFEGSLGKLVHDLRESGLKRNASAVIKYFPETGLNRTISCDSFKSFCRYNEHPDLRKKLLNKGRIRLNVPFFNRDILGLVREVYNPLFFVDKSEVKKAKKALEQLYRALKKIQQDYNQPQLEEGERNWASEDIVSAVNDFNKSLPPEFEKWKCDPLRHDIEKINELIKYSKMWLDRMKDGRKVGQPPRIFNMLIFHVVNRFTKRSFDTKKNPIMKDGKYRVCKNWHLICVALLWLHVNYEIPEIKAFIKTHGTEEASIALKKLTVIVKKKYQNFRRSGKGNGKFAGAFEDGSEFLGVRIDYSTGQGFAAKTL